MYISVDVKFYRFWYHLQMYCYSILRDNLLELLHGKLEEALEKCNSDARTWWRSLESCLHAFQAIAECVDIDESRHLPRFLEALRRLPYHQLDTRVVITALEAVGKLFYVICLPALIVKKRVNSLTVTYPNYETAISISHSAQSKLTNENENRRTQSRGKKKSHFFWIVILRACSFI